MSTMNMALYRLLVKMGSSEQEAEAAAIIDTSELATKADLHTAIAELKADLTWRMILMGGIFIAAISALKVFP